MEDPGNLAHKVGAKAVTNNMDITASETKPVRNYHQVSKNYLP